MEYRSLLHLINNLKSRDRITEDDVDKVEDCVEYAYLRGEITHIQFDYLNRLLEEINIFSCEV